MVAPMKYDLLLSGATVIDPSQGIDAVRDVAVREGRIAEISEGIDPDAARERIDLCGRILTPGWIDIHAHVYAGATTWGIEADAHCLATGVTTIVDAGSPGWANFIGFKEFVADRARTRTLGVSCTSRGSVSPTARSGRWRTCVTAIRSAPPA